MKALIIIIFASLLSLSAAQCNGTFTNSTALVSVSWTVTGDNSVEFTYTAPSNASQYTILLFSTTFFTSVNSSLTADFVYATNDNVEDWWISTLNPVKDTQDDLTDTDTSLANNILTVNFTRPVVSTDKTHDIDLNACRYIGWGFGGTAPLSVLTLPRVFGIFITPICLQSCDEVIIPSVTSTPLPSPTLMASPTPSSAVSTVVSLMIISISVVMATVMI